MQELFLSDSHLGVCHVFSNVSASRKVGYLKSRVGKAPRKQHGPSRASHHPLHPTRGRVPTFGNLTNHVILTCPRPCDRLLVSKLATAW